MAGRAEGCEGTKIPALTSLTDVPDGSPPLLAWCGPVAPLLRGPLGLLEGVHVLRELKSPGARPLWPRLGLARKVGVESACAVPGVMPWGDLCAVGALRWAWAHALTISAPWNQLPCMFGVSADVLSDFLRLATGGRKEICFFCQKACQTSVTFFSGWLSKRCQRPGKLVHYVFFST